MEERNTTQIADEYSNIFSDISVDWFLSVCFVFRGFCGCVYIHAFDFRF